MTLITEPSLRRSARQRAFSLIEVVVALGIFSVAITVVVGLLQPTVKSVTRVVDSNNANRIVGAINAKLASLGDASKPATLGYASVQDHLFPSNTNPATVTLTDTKLLYASKLGDKVGDAADTATWGGTGTASNADKFFEVMLVRGSTTTLSPVDTLASAATSSNSFVMFTVVLSWPAYTPSPDPTMAPALTQRQDRSQFIFNAAISR